MKAFFSWKTDSGWGLFLSPPLQNWPTMFFFDFGQSFSISFDVVMPSWSSLMNDDLRRPVEWNLAPILKKSFLPNLAELFMRYVVSLHICISVFFSMVLMWWYNICTKVCLKIKPYSSNLGLYIPASPGSNPYSKTLTWVVLFSVSNILNYL